MLWVNPALVRWARTVTVIGVKRLRLANEALIVKSQTGRRVMASDFDFKVRRTRSRSGLHGKQKFISILGRFPYCTLQRLLRYYVQGVYYSKSSTLCWGLLCYCDFDLGIS